MTRGTKILLFSLLGGGGLIVLICGGLVIWGVMNLKELPKAMASSDAFMDQIGRNDLDGAYASTTPEFQGMVTLDKFREIVAKYPVLTKQTKRSMVGLRIMQMSNGPRATVQYSITNPNNSVSATVVLKNTGQTWQVESLNLP